MQTARPSSPFLVILILVLSSQLTSFPLLLPTTISSVQNSISFSQYSKLLPPFFHWWNWHPFSNSPSRPHCNSSECRVGEALKQPAKSTFPGRHRCCPNPPKPLSFSGPSPIRSLVLACRLHHAASCSKLAHTHCIACIDQHVSCAFGTFPL